MKHVALLALAVIALAGCGGSDGNSGEPQLVDPSSALGLSGGTPVVVRGFFAHEPNSILPRMCSALAES